MKHKLIQTWTIRFSPIHHFEGFFSQKGKKGPSWTVFHEPCKVALRFKSYIKESTGLEIKRNSLFSYVCTWIYLQENVWAEMPIATKTSDAFWQLLPDQMIHSEWKKTNTKCQWLLDKNIYILDYLKNYINPRNTIQGIHPRRQHSITFWPVRTNIAKT